MINKYTLSRFQNVRYVRDHLDSLIRNALYLSRYGEEDPEREIAKRNFSSAFDFILEREDVENDYRCLLDLHAILMKDLDEGIKAELNETQIRELSEMINQPAKANLEIAIDVMLYILDKRLFADGDVRAAIMFANKLMVDNGCGIITVTPSGADTFRKKLKEYKDDMVKYASDDDKPYIRGCFDSITKQLAKDYKKFQYNLIKKDGRAEDYAGSLQWLEDAGMIHRCYNTEATGLPMEGNAIESTFKVYITDIGLLVTMLGGSTRNDIMQGNLGGFKGAIYENLMADTLHKKEQSLYYYRKESGMELDFLVNYKGECVPVEVKAKTAKAKSLSTALKHPDKYHVYHAVKFGDFNIGREGPLLTLPNYMQFLLDLKPEEIVLEPLDVDAMNAMAMEMLEK